MSSSSGILLLPSINRGVPRIASQSLSGIIAYGSRFSIYFIDARCNPPLVLDSKFIFGAHTGRIISLSFCKSKDVELIASVGDDGEVKVWDTESQTSVARSKSKEGTQIVEWIYGSSNLLVYPADTKNIIKWNIKTNIQIKIKTGSEILVTAIVSNEKSPHLLAVGHGSGTIAILDIVQENVLHRFKVHSLEITSLSWSTVSPDILLSASLDFSLRVWKMGDDKPVWTYYFPMSRIKAEDKKKLKIVGICHPKHPNVMICSNLRGDIGEVTFLENDKPKFLSYSLPSWEMSCKFTFAFCTLEGEDILYCFDPYKLSLWSITSKEVISQLHFLTAFVYDLTNSTVNPSLMAISNGDGILRIWNSQAASEKMDMVSIFVNYRTKIMTAAFHPTVENIIAYGTDEGRVGIIDIFKKKSVYCFETHHTGAVYSISWGPCENVLQENSEIIIHSIYSCGGGIIYINKENGAKESALNFDEIVQRPDDLICPPMNLAEVCWKSDYSCVCVGSFSGVIDIYSEKLTFLSRFNVQMKTVECLRWHPTITYMSPDGSDLKFWLACCGNDTEIHILDTSSAFDKDIVTSQGIVKKLLGHKKRISSICWSPHSDGFLVSASKDGTALVWNVQTATILATYAAHQDSLNAVQWSVFDQDIIYSGGHDSCVKQWKISEQSISAPPDKIQGKKRMRKSKPTPQSKPSENNYVNDSQNIPVSEENMEHKDESEASKNKDQAALEVSHRPSPHEHRPKKMNNKKVVLFPKLSIYSHNSDKEELEDCIKLAEILCKQSTVEMSAFDTFESKEATDYKPDSSKFGLFTDQLTALRMMETQMEHHKAAGEPSGVTQIGLMTGNIQSTLNDAAKNGNLSALHVSIAPSVSHLFWLEICEKYALQLIEEHQYDRASSYFLICGKTYEAINVLAEKGNIIDALALAKARLPVSDPLTAKLLNSVCKKFALTKNYIGEAKCLLALNEPLRASKALASTSDPKYLRAAANICKKYGLDREAVEYYLLCLEKGLMQCDWASVKMLLEQEPNMEVYRAFVTVHEVFYHHIRHFKKQEGISVQDIFSSHCAEELTIWKGNTCIDTKQSFVEFLYQLLQSHLDPSSLQRMLEAMDIFTEKRSFASSSDAHITTAIFITKFILLSILGDLKAAECIFLNIFAASHNIVFLPRIVCSLFFPMSLSWNLTTNYIICRDIYTAELEQNNVLSHSEAICRKFYSKISSYQRRPITSLITPKDLLLCNLRSIADTVCIALSTKILENHLIIYFTSSFIKDLARLIEKRDFKMLCKSGQSKAIVKDSTQTIEITSEVSFASGKESIGIVNDKSSDKTNDNMDTANNEKAPEVENDTMDEQLQELIDLALNEADEKTRLFMEEKANVPVDDNLPQFEEREHSPNTVLIDVVVRDHPNEPSESDSYTSAVSGDSVNKIIDDREISKSEPEITQTSKDEICNTSLVSIESATKESDIDLNDCDSHRECLVYVKPFFNIVSFVAQSVCIDHFALLYHLKERLKVLNQNRAAEGLSKVLKDMKMEKQIINNSKLVENNQALNRAEALIIDTRLGNTETDKSAIKSSVRNGEFEDKNSLGDSSDFSLTQPENTVVLEAQKIVSSVLVEATSIVNISDEPTSCPVTTPEGTVVIGSQKSVSSVLDMATHIPNVSDELADCPVTKPVVIEQKLVSSVLDEATSILNVSDEPTACSVTKTEGTVVIGSQKSVSSVLDMSTHIPNVSDELADCPVTKPVVIEAQKLTSFVLDEAKGILNVSDKHIYEKGDCGETAEKEVSAIELSEGTAPENYHNLQSEIRELSEVIAFLEVKCAEYPYPNPFDAVSDILKVLTIVVQKSSCSRGRKKLHDLIHEVINWCETFYVGEINFVCQVC